MPLAFATVDWWIVGAYMLIATIPGFFCRKYIKGQEDFLIAGRSLNIWLATATLTASEMGLITVMYMAEMGFKNGFSAMILGVICLTTTLFVGLTGFMVAGLRRSGVTTVAEYYEKRYGRGVRLLGGFIIATAGILNYGIFLQVEADFIRIITGIQDLHIAYGDGAVFTIPSINLVMSILVTIVLLYVLLGGMVSVVLTDYIQFVVLTVGMGAVTWWALRHPDVGGLSGIVEAVRQHRPGYGLNPFATAGTLGIGLLFVVWQAMHWLGTNTWQTQAFRTAATDSPRTAKVMWSLTAVNYFGRAIIPMLWGVAAIAFLSKTLSPAVFEELSQNNARQGMPKLLMALPAGLVGFMLAGMLAALMSTHSSYMLAWSGVITEDLLVPVVGLFGIKVPAGARIWITRFFILCLGTFLIVFGLWFKVKETIWGYLGLTGTMYIAGSSALVAMGLYWRRASRLGAYLGLLCGALPGLVYLAARIIVLLGESYAFTPPDFVGWLDKALTEARIGAISFPLAFLGMMVGSLLARRAEPEPAVEATSGVAPVDGGAA